MSIRSEKTRKKCDVCDVKIKDIFVKGKSKFESEHVEMCMSCFFVYGEGTGKKFRRDGETFVEDGDCYVKQKA